MIHCNGFAMPSTVSFSTVTAGNSNTTNNQSAGNYLCAGCAGVNANVTIPAVATLRIVGGLIVATS